MLIKLIKGIISLMTAAIKYYQIDKLFVVETPQLLPVIYMPGDSHALGLRPAPRLLRVNHPS